MTVTRRNMLAGAGAVVLGAGIAVTNGAIAAPARELTVKEAVAEFAAAYRLLFSRLQTRQISPGIGRYMMATAVTVERIEAFAHDDAARDPDANVARLAGETWPSWPGRVSS